MSNFFHGEVSFEKKTETSKEFSGKKLDPSKNLNDILGNKLIENKEIDQTHSNLLDPTKKYDFKNANNSESREKSESEELNEDTNNSESGENSEAEEFNNDTNNSESEEKSEAEELNNDTNNSESGEKSEAEELNNDTNNSESGENREAEKLNNDTNNSESGENSEAEELTEEEINEKQIVAIKEAFARILKGEKLTTEELGNLGEMMMDQYYIAKGYKPLNKHRVTSLDDKKGGFKTGIDGVYEKTNPDGSKSYVIADAKYNTSKLSETNDGKQMSDNWIDKRLDDAVGKEKADEIRDAAEDDPNSVKHEIYHIDPNIDEAGNTHTDTQEVDSEGNKIGDKSIVEYFDREGNRIEPSQKE